MQELHHVWSETPFLSHLRGEHVSDAVHGSLQQQTSHQEAEKHQVREKRAEVHHLGQREGEEVEYFSQGCHGDAFLRCHVELTNAH